MPSVRASARPNLGGWQALQTTQPAPSNRTAPAQPDPNERSPFMAASMPLMASTGDAFVRQFYTKTGLPSQRILPTRRGGAA
jgi:hypothetical protein